ncbi:M16 family metallopeptidase [Robertkochia flava]|uniref:M16 family metallopeptidase n=1 Tax=Robertkochia flava TaxID=3447986 RepID=UPI001CCDFD4E|nr:pitrilysin family protein [Robertkochia marina]
MKLKYLSSWMLTLLLIVGCAGPAAEKEEEQEFTLDYEKFTLDNGLEVVLHEDHSDPIVAVATLMHVGSNREKPNRTGFAHFFEHMSFNDSENVPRGANRKLIPEWGGERNGGTWSDGTIYYEVVPKDAFEKILWIDSDRFGYMINTVTEEALEREKQVVKNEKRERVDNQPYGYTDEIIRKHLYPEGHPYSWTVIGSLPDLQAATLEDVKEFYNQYYGAGNATLVIAGDIDAEKTKQLVERWFGEIRKGPEVPEMRPMPVTLDSVKSLYFEDNFAKLPELRMVYPTVEQYHKDSYALMALGQLLSGSKKAPLYKKIVEEKKLAPEAGTYQSSNELAGEFIFRVRANAGTDLDSVKVAIEEALATFEEEGISDTELKRIKAELETSLYRGVETVLNKAFTLVQDNEYKGDPAYITTQARIMADITKEDVMRVYREYIQGKPYVMTSFVPKGAESLKVEGAQLAEVWQEEIVPGKANEEVSQGEEAQYEKTPSAFDRSEPEYGELPTFEMPEVWSTALSQSNIDILGITYDELPLVSFDITIKGGHMLEPIEKSGLSSLMASMMMQGTVNKTPEELEEAIGLLGANISVYSGTEEMRISASCLARNFEETVALVEEILLEPRWDEKEFDRLKSAMLTNLKGREANPNAIAQNAAFKLLYGDDHILGISSAGTLETAESITLDDLKTYYENNVSASMANIHFVGMANEDRVQKAFAGIDSRWDSKEVVVPEYPEPERNHQGTIFFVDVPGAKQSVINGGQLALAGGNEDFNNLEYANEKLGGGSSGDLFQVLRIEKGYTYGAYSFIVKREAMGPFYLSTSVRSNATLPSMEIITSMLRDYGEAFDEEDVQTTRNKLLKSATLAYESMGAKLGILREISKYGRSHNFITKDQQELVNMTLADFKATIEKYMQEDEMMYLIVGDKATQLEEVKKLGKPVIELDIHGNPVGDSVL